MIKYNIINLKIVKVKEGKHFHYFICKFKKLTNSYTEIFTGKKILVKDEIYVESLSNYLSNLTIYDQTLMLTKQELLTLYIDINNSPNFTPNKENQFGAKNYQMKDTYYADNLVVANLRRISNEITNFGPKQETTNQKYIFEIITTEEKTKYREIFTGFIATDKKEYFNLPYVVTPTPFTNLFPETKGKEIPKLSLIWIQNDINYSKGKRKELKKKN